MSTWTGCMTSFSFLITIQEIKDPEYIKCDVLCMMNYWLTRSGNHLKKIFRKSKWLNTLFPIHSQLCTINK